MYGINVSLPLFHYKWCIFPNLFAERARPPTARGSDLEFCESLYLYLCEMHAHTATVIHTYAHKSKHCTTQWTRTRRLLFDVLETLAIITVAIHNIAAAEAVATATELYPDIGIVYVITCRKNEYLTAPATNQARIHSQRERANKGERAGGREQEE